MAPITAATVGISSFTGLKAATTPSKINSIVKFSAPRFTVNDTLKDVGVVPSTNSISKPKSMIQKIKSAPVVYEKEVTVLTKDYGSMDFIKSIISTQEENRAPFYVLDLGVLESLFQEWTRLLPSVRPFYAVKCNPTPALLGALAGSGAGFDCASRGEIEAVLALGVSQDRIVYANPCKSESEIRYAASVGVDLTTFDSACEIEKLRKWHPKCKLLIRIKGVQDDGAILQFGTKFGALTDEIKPFIFAAQSAGLAVVGVSFHIGSGATQFDAFEGSMEMAKKVFETVDCLGMSRMHILDIGGGFTAGALFPKAASTIEASVQSNFSNEPTDFTVMAEPGRYFASTTFTLATTIIGKRIRGERREYWINDGIYGCMGEIRDGLKITNIIPLKCTSNNPTSNNERKLYESIVFGHTLDSLDTIVNGYLLPELEVNDWLVFPDMGAYTVAGGTNFNGFNTSAISTHLAYSAVYIRKKEVEI